MPVAVLGWSAVAMAAAAAVTEPRPNILTTLSASLSISGSLITSVGTPRPASNGGAYICDASARISKSAPGGTDDVLLLVRPPFDPCEKDVLEMDPLADDE